MSHFIVFDCLRKNTATLTQAIEIFFRVYGACVVMQKKAKNAKISVAIKGAKSTAEDILKVANFNKLYDFE